MDVCAKENKEKKCGNQEKDPFHPCSDSDGKKHFLPQGNRVNPQLREKRISGKWIPRNQATRRRSIHTKGLSPFIKKWYRPEAPLSLRDGEGEVGGGGGVFRSDEELEFPFPLA